MNEQNNNQLVVLPRRSRRLATIIPASHWISMGYSQNDARLMENLQNDLKNYCDSSGGVDIDLNGRNDIGELPHHDLMIPHWKKFAKALKGRTSVPINAYFTGISLPTSVLDIVFPAFQLVNIVELTLFGTGLGDEGFQCLSSFLGNNSSLTSLGVGVDQLEDLSVATALSDAFNDHPALEEVFIGDCAFHTSLFEKILEGCTRKKRFTLTLVNFDADDIIAISYFIRSNHPLEELHLRDNNITDNDAKLLALSLKTNKHLKELVLRGNSDITEEGEKALLKAMYDPSSMDSIVESNHICKAYAKAKNENFLSVSSSSLFHGPISDWKEVLYTNGLDISIQKKIRKKVVLALCRQDGELFDLSNFNDIPLGVMPQVLELIQEHAIARTKIRFNNNTSDQLEKDALSRLFHTLRGWELPPIVCQLTQPTR